MLRAVLARAVRPMRTAQPVRHLNLHEYQSSALMAAKGVNVPVGYAAKTVDEAVAAAKKIGDAEVVIKAQILAGGRGLGTFTNGFKGGVHIIKTEQVAEYAGKMLGQTLVTKQSGPAGKPVNTIMIAKKMELKREMYFSILLNRPDPRALVIACAVGGTSIEDLAHSNPEAIVKVSSNFMFGVGGWRVGVGVGVCV
ncbi:ATP-grasp domain-containing protein [Pavlovales sp. CCMP2436]|nr:ATP-grasp domain-containing protein [Pavlovales sp. CCMP2436]